MLVGNRVRLRAMVTTDAEAILKIYEEGIQTGHATFEAEVPDWHIWDYGHLTQCRWLAEEDDTVLGWGALTKVSPRKVYSGVAEVSIYVSLNEQNKGIESILLERLIISSKESGFGHCRLRYFRKTKSASMYMKNTVSEKSAHADNLPRCLMAPWQVNGETWF